MKTGRRFWGPTLAGAIVLGALSWGCDDDSNSSNNPGTGGSGGFSTGSGGTGGSGGGGTVGGGGNGTGGNTAALVSDGAALGVMLDANMGEVQTGQVALTKSANADVRAFATQIIADHTGAIARLQAISTSEQIAAEDSPQRTMVQAQAANSMTQLEQAAAAQFDVTFVAVQVMLHASVLQMLDSTLIPSTDNPQLKAELQMERNAVQMHLTHAQALQLQLGGGGADGGTAGADGG
jgi:putative membrane protein